MTSKNLFIKFIKENSKRRIAVIALSILGLFLALPISGALSINIWMNRLEMGRTKYEDMISTFSTKIIGMENIFLVTLVFLFSVLIGINGFCYLFSKQKTDLYHSIPVRRDTMFFVSYLNGILYFAIPYAGMLAFTLILGKMYHLVNGDTLATAVTAYFATMLCYIMLYTTAVLAAMLTGNVIISLLATGVFFAYGPCVKALYWGYHEVFFWGFYSHSSMWDNARYYSPVTLYQDVINAITEHTVVGNSRIIEAIIVTLILAALSLIIYRKRPSEAAGHAIAFPKLCPLIKFFIIIPVALASGLFFREMVTRRSQQDIWFAFGILFALVVAHAIMEIIFRFDFKAAVKNMPHLILAFGITTVIAVIFRFDLFGYSSYLPKSNSIESIGMDISAFNSGNTYYNFDDFSEEMSDSEFYATYYQDTEDYLLKNVKLTDVDTCLTIAKDGIQYSKQLFSARYSKLNSMNLESSDEYDTHQYSYITFCYHLQNGENVYRRYYVDLTENMDLLNQLYTSNEYKETVFPILTLSDSRPENFHYYSPLGAYTLDVLTDEELYGLLQTYQKELRAQDFASLADSYPIGYFACKRDLPNMRNYYNTEYNQGYVFPSFTETIALLEKYKIPIYDYADIDNIAGIHITYYNYDYDGFESDTIEKSYTDAKDIVSFMKHFIPTDNFYATGLLRSGSGNLHIEVTYKKTPNGFANFCSFECPADSIPEKIRKDFDYSD